MTGQGEGRFILYLIYIVVNIIVHIRYMHTIIHVHTHVQCTL